MATGINGTNILGGSRILIVEDEIFIALDMGDTLRDAGAEIVGPCSTLEAAHAAVSAQRISAAVLDIRLGKQTTETVARALRTIDVPFLFCSGQTLPADMLALFPGARVLNKPIMPLVLVSAVIDLLGDNWGRATL
jgi:DNA-binding response OmpR family regulator